MNSLTLGLSTTAVGMLVVFCGLIILIACIYTMTCLTVRKAKAPAAPKAEDLAKVASAPVYTLENGVLSLMVNGVAQPLAANVLAAGSNGSDRCDHCRHRRRVGRPGKQLCGAPCEAGSEYHRPRPRRPG